MIRLALIGLILALVFTTDGRADGTQHPIITPELRAQIMAQTGYLPTPLCPRAKHCPN